MNNTILLKRSNSLNLIPKLTDIQLGELAINTNDGDIFFKRKSTIPGIPEELNKFAVYKTVHSGDSLTVEAIGNDQFRINGDRTSDFPIGTPFILSNGTEHHDASITTITYSTKEDTIITFSPVSTFTDATMVMFNPLYLNGLVVDGKIYYNEGGVYTEIKFPTGLERFIDSATITKEGWKFIDNPSVRTGLGSVNLMRVGDAIQDGVTYVDGIKYKSYTTTEIDNLHDSELGTFVFDTTKNTLVQCLDATVGANIWGIKIDGGTY